MKKNELKMALADKGVPKELYNLDGIGRKDERFCIESHGNKWIVYFAKEV